MPRDVASLECRTASGLKGRVSRAWQVEARSSTGLNGAIIPSADPAAVARALGEYLSPGRYVTDGWTPILRALSAGCHPSALALAPSSSADTDSTLRLTSSRST
jgi:hypothetical protein